jgi:hypothetical protein
MKQREATSQTQIANIAKEMADENAKAANMATSQARVARDRAATQFLAIQARRAVAEADTPDRIEQVAALAVESIQLARNASRPAEADAVEAARFAVIGLPLQVLSHGKPYYAVRSLVVLNDGRLASGGEDGKIKLWPLTDKGEPITLSHGSGVQSLAVLKDGRLASGGDDGKIKLWPLDDKSEPITLSHGSRVQSLAVLKDGRLASGGDDGQIKLWPPDGKSRPMTLTRHWWETPLEAPVSSLAVLKDGRLASAGKGRIKLWPLDGKSEPVILQHTGEVRSLVVLEDGRLASASDDGRIKLWPRDGVGEPVLLSHGNEIQSLAVLADGRLVSSGNRQIKLWLVEDESLVAALCLRAGRNFTQAEWLHYIGSDIPWHPSCRNRPSNWRTPER